MVAEAIANVGKHSNASSAAIRVARSGDLLVVEVEDDGDGGADPRAAAASAASPTGSPLSTGALLVSSPTGGPTVLRAEIPCAS